MPAAIVLVGLVISLLSIVGYVMNFVEVVSGFIHEAPVTVLFVGHVIGIFVPAIGAVLGYF